MAQRSAGGGIAEHVLLVNGFLRASGIFSMRDGLAPRYRGSAHGCAREWTQVYASSRVAPQDDIYYPVPAKVRLGQDFCFCPKENYS